MTEARRPNYRALGGRRFHPGRSPAQWTADSLHEWKGARPVPRGEGGPLRPPTAEQLARAERFGTWVTGRARDLGLSGDDLAAAVGFPVSDMTSLALGLPADSFCGLAGLIGVGLGELWQELRR